MAPMQPALEAQARPLDNGDSNSGGTDNVHAIEYNQVGRGI